MSLTDISKCSGEGCPLKNNCRRFTSYPNVSWQSYISPPFKDGECGMFYPNSDQKSKPLEDGVLFDVNNPSCD